MYSIKKMHTHKTTQQQQPTNQRKKPKAWTKRNTRICDFWNSHHLLGFLQHKGQEKIFVFLFPEAISINWSPSGGRRKTRSNKNTRMWGWEVGVRTQPLIFPAVYGKLTLPSNLLLVTSHHAESLRFFPAFPVFHFYCLILIGSQLIHILL